MSAAYAVALLLVVLLAAYLLVALFEPERFS